MSRSGREALPDVRDALLDVRELSGSPHGCPGVFERSSRMSGSGLEALSDVQELSGGSHRCPEVVGRPYRMSGSGWETLPDVRSPREALLDVRQ